MAGYAKLWTIIYDDEWFVALSGPARGLWLQLIIWAKLHGDTGMVCLRSYSAAAAVFGYDDSTTAKFLRFFALYEKVVLTEVKNCITIKIVNYQKYQELTPQEATQSRRKRGEKSPEFRPLPDQTRPDQTRERESTPLSLSVSDLVEIYHQHCPRLPKVQGLKSGQIRYREAAARIQENPERQFWDGYFQRIGASDFLAGVNDRGWKANFEWVVRSNNFLKANEGQYDNRDQRRVLEMDKDYGPGGATNL